LSHANAATLNIAKPGVGNGTVIGGGSYAAGAPVALTATADAGSTFAGWSPEPCAASFAMPANDLTCTATFTPSGPTYALTVNKAGTGSGAVTSNPAGIDCGSDCSEPYLSGTPVTLSATPASGYTFSGWSGACTGTGACTVTMTAAKSVTATFTK
jgi:uncharacterized repeat protein (TIGR02543 family)